MFCINHSDCLPKQKCAWGQCFDVDGSCSMKQNKKLYRYGVVPTWEKTSSSAKQCSSPLKCIDGICKPQSCYSKRDCDRDEECFKWQQSSGICYRVECKKSSDCPPGHGCNSGICIKNFCSRS